MSGLSVEELDEDTIPNTIVYTPRGYVWTLGVESTFDRADSRTLTPYDDDEGETQVLSQTGYYYNSSIQTLLNETMDVVATNIRNREKAVEAVKDDIE